MEVLLLGAAICVVVAGTLVVWCWQVPPLDTVAVLVLGDFGRSPRMQNHAVSLANSGKTVVVFAYKGSAPHSSVRNHARIRMRALAPFTTPAWLPSLVGLPLKAALQAVFLCAALVAEPFAVLLVQNPPAIPTLAIGHAVCFFRRARLVIDWHNFGFTILRCSLGDRRRQRGQPPDSAASRALVRVAEMYERFFGRGAAAHFCVSEAMADDLRRNWGVHPLVLYDRPPARFAPVTTDEAHGILADLHASLAEAAHPPLPADVLAPGSGATLATRLGPGGKAVPRTDRPAIIVTSTSWTPDEDFGVLLCALRQLDVALQGSMRVVVIITGKGPLRSVFESRLRGETLTRVHVATVWLKAEDYPRLLACADLGICLHASSSGLDLPMKVVDLFGAGVPVLALRYGCIEELVPEGDRGHLFSSADELSTLLVRMLEGFPNSTATLGRLREGVRSWRGRTWEDAWRQEAAATFA